MTAAFAIVRAFLGKLPWQAYALMAAIGIVLIAYAKGYDTARDKYKAQMAELVADTERAAQEARARQIAVNQAAQERYNQLATEADRNAEIYQSAAMDAARRFIAANRVRPDVGSGPDGAGSPASGDSASSGNGAGGEAELAAGYVIVPADDIRICTINTTRLMAVQEWALGLAGD